MSSSVAISFMRTEGRLRPQQEKTYYMVILYLESNVYCYNKYCYNIVLWCTSMVSCNEAISLQVYYYKLLYCV